MILHDQAAKQCAVVLLRDAVKDVQRKYALREDARREFPAGRRNAHRLMIEEAERQSVKARRLYPALLKIELHKSNPLQEFPRDRRGQQRARVGGILAYDEPHLGRQFPASRAPHPLEK